MNKYQDNTSKEKASGRRILVSVCATVVCFIALSILYAGLTRHDLETERTRYGYIARNEVEHIITTIDCVMARTNTLEAMIQDHNGDTAFFDLVAESVYRDVTEETGVKLKNFAVAPDGIVSKVYPLEGNEALIGFNFLDMSFAGNKEAKDAYEQGKTILTNPFELVQGGVGMGGRAPVMLRDGDREELWGLVTVTIDYENLIEVLGLDNLEGMGVNYALSYIDADGNSHVMHSGGALDDHPVKEQFMVRNLTWELTVSPKKGWISNFSIVLSALIVLIISGFAGLFTTILLKLRETNVMLYRLSHTDQLTGAPNRRSYQTAISELASKPIEEDFVYVSADLNGLKQTNDTYGHPAGDELICGAAGCLREAFEGFGSVYRIGGDEFAALIHTGGESPEGIIDKLRSLTREWRGKNVKELSMSVGYVSHSEYPEATMDKLIRTADKRMYEDKRAYYKSEGIDRRDRSAQTD